MTIARAAADDRALRFTTAMVAMAEVFNEPMTPVKIQGYAEALASTPIGLLERGAKRLIATAKFFPRPIEWEEMAIDIHLADATAERTERANRRGIAQRSTVEDRSVDVKSLLGAMRKRLGWPSA